MKAEMQGDAPHLKSGHLTKRLFRVCADMVLGRQNHVPAVFLFRKMAKGQATNLLKSYSSVFERLNTM